MSDAKTLRISDLDFAESEQSAQGWPSFNDSAPSFLDPSYSGSTSLSVLGSPFKASYSLAAGLSGGLDFPLRTYGLDYPATIAATPRTIGEDGQVSTVDPALVSANDAAFSITGASASDTPTSSVGSSGTPALTLGASASASPELTSGASASASPELTPRASHQVTSGASQQVTSGASPELAPRPNHLTSATETVVTNLDFTGSGQNVAGSPSINYSLPSFLDPSYSTSTSLSVLGVPFKAGFSISAGLSGGLDVSLGTYQFNYPVTVDVTLPTDVADSQVFTVDPTLGGADDATFSMTGPSASLTLSLGFKGGITASYGSLFSFDPSFSLAYSLPTSHTFEIPEVPGASFTLAEPKSFDDFVNASSNGSLPTLTASGSGNNFLSAQLDLFKMALGVLDDTIAPGISALDGSSNFGFGSVSYSLMSLPLQPGSSLASR